MIYDFFGRAFNLDLIRSFRKGQRLPDGTPQTKVVYSNGDEDIIPVDFDRVVKLGSLITPAPEGYFVVRAWFEDEKWQLGDQVPVLLFRYDGYGDMMPVTVEGEMNDDANFAVVYPNGLCRDYDGRHKSVEDWLAQLEKPITDEQ